MRNRGKVAAIALCFGVLLLLYLWGPNAAADGPLLKEVAEEEKAAAAAPDGHSTMQPPPRQQQEQRRDVAAKLARKQPAAAAGVGVRTEELLKRRKEGKATNRGVRAKR